jgi:5'-nucleotidase/UDP-sugar diphosphatase
MRLLATLAILTITLATIGCASQKPAADTLSSGPVTDTAPMASSATAYKAEPLPTTVTPLAPVQEVAVATTPTGPAASGNTHVVKKGETLYCLAKQKYGDGKQWQRIASANPGVTPSSLKVGQTLVIP